MGLFDVQAVCNRMRGEREQQELSFFYFCFQCVVVFGILAYVLMKHTFNSLTTRGFYSVLNSLRNKTFNMLRFCKTSPLTVHYDH